MGKTIEIYIDGMVIKSKKQNDHIRDLDECFQILRKHGMCLNPAKCAFKVSSGQFLGYMVSRRGIKANPTQIKTLAKVKTLETVRDVQRLTGKITTLNRFISRISDRCQPFFPMS